MVVVYDDGSTHGQVYETAYGTTQSERCSAV